MPLGMNPPWLVRLARPPPAPGHRPRMKARPTHRNTTIAATLMEANQYSDSPQERTDSRFSRLNDTISPRVSIHGRHLGVPVVDQARAGHRLQRHHDDPEVPVHPAGQEAGEIPEGQAVVLVEAADRGIRRGHLSQHPHHQHHQRTGECEGDHRRRTCRLDHDAAADEESRTDHPAQGNHLHVAAGQGAPQAAVWQVVPASRACRRGGHFCPGSLMQGLSPLGCVPDNIGVVCCAAFQSGYGARRRAPHAATAQRLRAPANQWLRR